VNSLWLITFTRIIIWRVWDVVLGAILIGWYKYWGQRYLFSLFSFICSYRAR
jgi:hypothetical protein